MKGGTFGVETIDHFTWKDLFDSYACTECGRCQNVCPATSTGKPLNPRQVIHDIKINLLTNGPLMKEGQSARLSLIARPEPEGSITEDQIWSCTTCGACMEVCPVFIEQMPKLLQLRRHLVEMKAHFPEELLESLREHGAAQQPLGHRTHRDGPSGAAQLDVKPFDARDGISLLRRMRRRLRLPQQAGHRGLGPHPRCGRRLLGHPGQG